MKLEYIKLIKHNFDLNKSFFEYLHQIDFQYIENQSDVNMYQYVKIAKIVANELKLDYNSIIATLLLPFKINTTTELIDNEAIDIYNSLVKIKSISVSNVDKNAVNFFDLVLNLITDVRAILIKLAENLYFMRIYDALDSLLKNKILSECNYIYAPLTHKLGLYNIKSELDEIILKIEYPDIFNFIKNRLVQTFDENKIRLSDFVKPIENALIINNIHFSIKSRTKSIASIYSKIKNKNVSFDEVSDIFAIRIIVNSNTEDEISDCWKVFSIVTQIYESDSDRFRDWLTTPKANGYESLHTTVKWERNKLVEVQIRSERMDKEAELGQAAHWRYKGYKENKNSNLKLDLIKQLIKAPDIEAINENFKIQLKRDNFIYVFTPKFDVIKLLKGSSILDFAFKIHTNIGLKCIGGKINNKFVSYKNLLKNGDIVEVVTSKNQMPNLDWLNFIADPKTKNKIKRIIKETEFKHAEIGKEIVKRKLKQLNYNNWDEAIVKILKHFKVLSQLELFNLVADEKIDTNFFKNILEKKGNEPNKEIKDNKLKSNENILIINNSNDINEYNFAKCCLPEYGDDVFGFITIKDGLKIHKTVCPNAKRLLNLYPYRVIKACWNDDKNSSLTIVKLKINGIDNIGVISKISDVVSNEMKMDIKDFAFNSNKGTFEGNVKVVAKSANQIEVLIKKLISIKGVVKVSRK